MGLFDIFTRTKRRDELLGEIAPLLTQAKSFTFSTPNKLTTGIITPTIQLIQNSGNDIAIVDPVKTILRTLINQGMPTDDLSDIRSSALDAYYSHKMYDKKNDTKLLREIEKLIVSRLEHDGHHTELLETIHKTSPYKQSRQDCSKIFMDLAQIQSINGHHEEALNLAQTSFEDLPTEEQEKAIKLINKACLSMKNETEDSDTILTYYDFVISDLPNVIQHNMMRNFLNLYTPSGIDKTARKEFVKTTSIIYSISKNAELKFLAYNHIDELANLVAKDGDLDSSLQFRREIITKMQDTDPLLTDAITAWDKDISMIKSPAQKFKASINSLESNQKLFFFYASPKISKHILTTANKFLPDMANEVAPRDFEDAIHQLLEKLSSTGWIGKNKKNTDLGANIVLNAYDLLDKSNSYITRDKILSNVLEITEISPPTIHRTINGWVDASKSEAKTDPTAPFEAAKWYLRRIKEDFLQSLKDYQGKKEFLQKLPVDQKIILEGVIDVLDNIYPYMKSLDDKLTIDALLIDHTGKDTLIHQNAVSRYASTYKSAKEQGKSLEYLTSDAYPIDIPKDLKAVFKEVEKWEKNTDLGTKTDNHHPTARISPKAFEKEFRNG